MGKAAKASSTNRKQEGKYVELPGAEPGKVVVRFPPEASGFLHVGHAKAALLNQYYQLAFDGKLVFRFDDTNPDKEKEDFEQVIREDVSLLQIKPDICSYTSDYFDLYIEKCVQLIRDGKAYVDDTPAEVMKQQREERTESANRNNSVEKNLQLWQEMITGSEKGLQCCVRAKIDMNSPNGCLRDPAMYRCKKQPHPRTGSRYNVYPTYDFSCPIIDSIEGVTHSLRTTEYVDRDVQYSWFLDQLNMRKPHVVSYSRLNLQNTVLSKRKLTWFVENKVVHGWDDPRMPTVRGILRRGMTVEGLKQFIVSQGSSRAAVVMEWDKIWSFNKKVIDADAVRYAAVCDAVKVTITDAPAEGSIDVSRHPKNAELGTRTRKTGPHLLVDREDAEQVKVGESVTFVNWGNMRITEVRKNSAGVIEELCAQLNLDDKDFKKTLKCTWINENDCKKAVLRYYDHLIAKSILAKDDEFRDFMNTDSKFEVTAFVEPEVAALKKGDIIQILRKGFFICDAEATANESATLIFIPDGSTDMNVFPPLVRQWKAKNLALIAKNDAASKETAKPVTADAAQVTALLQEIATAGDRVRKLKADKAEKSVVDAAVKSLLELKAKFKALTGTDWTQGCTVPSAPVATASSSTPAAAASIGSSSGDAAASELADYIKGYGDQIRQLKGEGAPKDQWQPLVDQMNQLKLQYKNQTGMEYKPADGQAGGRPAKAEKGSQSNAKPAKVKAAKPDTDKKADAKAGDKKQTRLGLEASKSENFADWYTEVITKAELIEYYDVSGCYILRPWSYAIWETIQSFLDAKIKQEGVSNCYFPMFVTQAALNREKDHIADFAPEVAWVTKSGDSEMPEPVAIRPTSETVMYPAFAKWVQSHRDLPIRLNQWCNIVRWEFKNPTPFLRTREFLWQEGHSAWANRDEAIREVYTMLDHYASVYEYLLAVPVVKGRKTEKEKFPGGDFTTTIEGFISANGRGIQAATSHHLGENFSKMFNIVFQNPDNLEQKCHAYQNSYGLTTRSIGTMIMTHSDDKGLVLPPRVASIQVIVVPCGITASTTDDQRRVLITECEKLEQNLKDAGFKCKSDTRDQYSPGWKYNHWELKGVPVRIEFGPKDLEKQSFVAVRRDDGSKITVPLKEAVQRVGQLLEDIQSSLFTRAKQLLTDNVVTCTEWSLFTPSLDQKKLLLSPFCGSPKCEEKIKQETSKDDGTPGAQMGAKSLCIPLEQPRPVEPADKCIHPACQSKPQFFTLFGRSY
jgi:bifunctional glutamyl/prolyl-tRNA synthetase